MDSRQVRKPGAADPTREMRPSGSYRVQFTSTEDNGRHGLVKGLLERPEALNGHFFDRFFPRRLS